MADPIKIVVVAQTEEAAAKLRKFAGDSGGGLEIGLKKAAKASAELSEGLGSNRMAMMELGHVARATGEGIAMGMNPLRVLAFEGPRLLQILSYTSISMGTIAAGAAALTPLILTGAEAWKAYAANVALATSEHQLFDQTIDLIGKNFAALAAAQSKGLISPQDAAYIEKLLSLGTGPALASAQKRLANLGISAGSMATLTKIQKLEDEMHVHIIGNLEAEGFKAQQVYDKRMADIKALDNAGKLDHDEADKARQMAMDEFNAASKRIDDEKQKQNEAKLTKDIEDDLFFYQQRLAGQRKMTANEEFIYRTDKFRQAAKLGEVSEDALSEYVIAQEKRRVAGVEQEQNAEKKVTGELSRQLELQISLARTKAEAALHEIQSNPFLSDADKARQSVPKIQGALAANNADIWVNQGIAANSPNDAARAQALTKINELTQQQVDLQRQLQAAQGENSFTSQLGLSVKHLQDMNNLAKEVADTFQNVFNAVITDVSRGITGLIMGTMTWKQFLAEIPQQILTEIVGAIVEMGVRWIATQILMHTVGKLLQGEAVGSATAPASALAAIWSGPATLATIATLGSAALEAPGAIGIAESVVQGISAFAAGGRPPVGEISLVGERGPELFVPDSAGTIIPNHRLSDAIYGGRSTSSGGGGGGGKGGGASAHVILVNDRSEMMNALKSADAEQVIVAAVRKNRLKIGIVT